MYKPTEAEVKSRSAQIKRHAHTLLRRSSARSLKINGQEQSTIYVTMMTDSKICLRHTYEYNACHESINYVVS
jgi:hypothetical protein